MNAQLVLNGYSFEPHKKYSIQETKTPSSSPNKPRVTDSPKPSPSKSGALPEALSKALYIVQNASKLGSGDAEKTAKLYFGAGLSNATSYFFTD